MKKNEIKEAEDSMLEKVMSKKRLPWGLKILYSLMGLIVMTTIITMGSEIIPMIHVKSLQLICAMGILIVGLTFIDQIINGVLLE